MKFILLYFALWFLGIISFIIFSIFHKIVIRNLLFAVASLGAGAAAVGSVAVEHNADIGSFILVVLAGGIGALTLPMLAIDKYFRTGRFCRKFKHIRGDKCQCKRCGWQMEHERGNDCKCKICGAPMNHEWIRRGEGECFVECSVCGFKRDKEKHSWNNYSRSPFKTCSICGLMLKVKTDIRISKKDSPCKKNEGGHHTAGCYCKYCDDIIIEAPHTWVYQTMSSHDGSGETIYKCDNCDLRRHEWFNPYTEGTDYNHDRLVKK